MDIREIYRVRILSHLQRILYDDDKSLFSYGSRDTTDELRKMKRQLEAGESPTEILNNSLFARAELSHCVTLSGYCPDDGSDIQIVDSSDYLLREDVRTIANAMLADHVFSVGSVKLREAYLSGMCIHRYIEIEFVLSGVKLQKLFG